MSANIPAVVLGAGGYVGGELLRLIAAHPTFELTAAVSDSRAGSAIGDTFAHLTTTFRGATFSSLSDWLDRIEPGGRLALFSAAPHGASAAVIADAIKAAEDKGI
ncbi:MAG: hypothetical protein KJO46_03975, partial [Gammaproteobacteria bacterium]|nr:hypothetical protein [Gammaproteobacteria bacterium]